MSFTSEDFQPHISLVIIDAEFLDKRVTDKTKPRFYGMVLQSKIRKVPYIM